MRDPIPAPTRLVELTKPYADKLSLYTLPWHAHEVLIGFFAYHFILYCLSPTLSRIICPNVYRKFSKRTQLNWDIHWVSMIQALFVNTAALYVIVTDAQRKEMDWRGRLWGYTPASGMVQGFAAGYFLWDLQISAQYIALSGPSALLHAIGALAVTCIGFVGSPSAMNTRNHHNRAVSTNNPSATLRQLLRPLLRPLRALHPLPQHPLVLRQTQLNRFQTATLQRHRAPPNILLLPPRLGHLPIHPNLLGHLQSAHDLSRRRIRHRTRRRQVPEEREWRGPWGSREL
jgi:hypothetical protein